MPDDGRIPESQAQPLRRDLGSSLLADKAAHGVPLWPGQAGLVAPKAKHRWFRPSQGARFPFRRDIILRLTDGLEKE